MSESVAKAAGVPSVSTCSLTLNLRALLSLLNWYAPLPLRAWISSPMPSKAKSAGSPLSERVNTMVGEVLPLALGQRMPEVMFVPEVFMSWERPRVPVVPLTACPARSLTLTATDAPFAPVRLKVTLNPDGVCARSMAARTSSKQHSEVRR